MNWFLALFSNIGKFFSGPALKRASAAVKKINDAIEYAMPAVEMVAALTPLRTDDEIIRMYKKIKGDDPTTGLKPGEGLSKENRLGLLMNAAGVLMRENLEAAIRQAGRDGLKIGEQYVTDVAQVPTSVINAATQAAYAMLKAANTTK